MSYQVIARKWRPQSFDEVKGQGHVTAALRNAIRSDRMPHALLLSGPRGVGKTTLARLIARSLNCEKGPTDTPCGSCIPCEEITAGRSTDVQEVDAASRTGVEDVRELIEAIRYAAAPGKHRIFIVDEVHMLSTAAFNALLKTLEEPPPRSLFLLATTNPEKIPSTVLSRCQRYDLRRIATAEIIDSLRTISEAEGVTISESGMIAIARESDGSLRDAQTLLDQLIAYRGSEISDETVAEVLDLTDRRVLLALVQSCVESNPVGALQACNQALAGGADPKRLASELVRLLRDLVVLQIAPKQEGLVEGGEAELAELQAIAQGADATRLRRMFRALVKEQEDLAWAPQPGAVLEMAVIRLATLPSGEDVGQLLARLDQLERQLASGAGGSAPPAPGGGAGSSGGAAAPRAGKGRSKRARPARSETRPALSEASAAEPTRQEPPQGEPPRDEPPAPTDADAAAALAPLAAETVLEEPARGAPQLPLDVVFERLQAFAQERDRGAFAVLEGARLVSNERGTLRIAARNPFQARRLGERRGALEVVCGEFFGTPTKVIVDAPDESGDRDDPSATLAARAESHRKRQAALEHPTVNVALEVLEAEIVEVRPLPSR